MVLLRGLGRPFMMMDDGTVSNQMRVKITNRSLQFFDIIVDIEVRDLKHLTDILAALRAAGFRWGGGSWTGRCDDLPEAVRVMVHS